MADKEHDTYTDPQLHEPRGITTAPSGSMYIADGAGSGIWTVVNKRVPVLQHGVVYTNYNIARGYSYKYHMPISGILKNAWFDTTTSYSAFTNGYNIEVYVGSNLIVFDQAILITASSVIYKKVAPVSPVTLSAGDIITIKTNPADVLGNYPINWTNLEITFEIEDL